MIDRWGGEGVDFGKIGEIIRLLEWMMGGYQDDEASFEMSCSCIYQN